MASEKPGIISNALAAWGGKIKTAQAASAKNQAVTNTLAAKSLGMPEGTELTERTFNGVRAKAAQAYKAVAESVPQIFTDETFKTQIAGLGGRSSQAAQHFPELMENEGLNKLVKGLGKADG